MCQSLAQGGRRCAGAATGAARRRLTQAVTRHTAAGRVQAAADARAALERLDAARAVYGNVVTPMALPLPESVHDAMTAIRDAGFRPMVVGGAVRDALLDGQEPKDIDIEVFGASIDEVAAVLRRSRYHLDEVGRAFGILKARLPDGTDLDVSVPRRDNHVGAGHRGFDVEMDKAMTAAEAAERRDFTVNAMGFDPQFGVCVDPHGGRADLTRRVLRHTSEKFAEDPLRVLRAVQFAARHKMVVAPETVALCRSLVGRAAELPVERVRGEFGKLWAKGASPSRGLAVLGETGWDATVPGLAAVNRPEHWGPLEAAAKTARIDGYSTEERTVLMAALLARHMPEADARSFLRHTVEGGDPQRGAFALSRAVPPVGEDDTAVRSWARSLGAGRASVRAWSRLARATGQHERAARLLAAAERLGCADGPQPDLIQGRDILPAFPGRKPGPWVGQVVAAARDAQDRGVFTDMDGAAAWLARHDPAA